ncbi:uncharacterized protein LOC143258454 isoform X2 [Tachypleus tridentatus]|uniref:uncharacterized protein LOC143258454 isoform X2 n=1 Tax=Tachypleus tridentatus TaxID=6853 RepID=UPI003FD51853
MVPVGAMSSKLTLIFHTCIILCKDYKKMTCSLMAALFTKQEMINSHVTGKRLTMKSGETKAVLNQDKVNLIIDFVKSHFSNVTETQIREKMTQKCKDLRITHTRRIKRGTVTKEFF